MDLVLLWVDFLTIFSRMFVDSMDLVLLWVAFSAIFSMICAHPMDLVLLWVDFSSIPDYVRVSYGCGAVVD